MSLASGTRLATYEIVSLLGSGGMGEVYKAKDLKLGRDVAVKVLPKELASDAERLKRFEQEARAASALDHPNIVTIHDIAEADGVHFIVMQFVEGKTLREMIGRGDLELSKTLHYAIQIADGLARAHRRGIVHRDLKPDNIMVTEEGLVEILDFGLAKLIEPSDRTEASTRDMEQPHTKEGHIVGTAPYMSPEQAQGKKELDARSDIFSFGSVLHELVTRRRAFAAQSLPELLTAIIREEPSKVSELVPSVPLDLDKLITRALRKEPERRFQSMADMRVALLEIKEELDSGSFVSAEQVSKAKPQRGRKTWLWIAAVVVALAMGAAGWFYFSQSEPASPPLTSVPLTSSIGNEAAPALSPDGNQVVYRKRGSDGHFHLFVKLIGGGEPLQITNAPSNDGSPAWTPDGREIAFIRRVEGEGGTYVRGIFAVSALGGSERQIVTSRFPVNHGLSFSPDGNLLAMVDRELPEDRDSIFLLSLETGESRRLTTPPSHSLSGDRLPRFSPDGETLAFLRGPPRQSDIYIVPVEGGEPTRLTLGDYNTNGLDWTPEGTRIVFSSGRVGVLSRLWRIPASGGEPELLGVGEEGEHPSVSRKGHRLVYVKRELRADIWRVGGITATDGEKKSPAPFISSTRWDYFPQYSPGGQQILFTSSRTGYQEIWICDSDGANFRQLTSFEDPLTVGGSWSPDGRQIAFTSSKEGSSDNYVVNATGGFASRLTTGPWDDKSPNWSGDGRWIYFSSNRTGRREVWKMPAEGGEPVQLTEHGGILHLESPDGRFLYFGKRAPAGGPPGIWRIPINGGEEVQVLEHGGFYDWALVEQGICYLNRQADPGPAIEFFEFATGKVSPVTVLEDASSWGFSVSSDGRWILYVKTESTTDIMLVENFH